MFFITENKSHCVYRPMTSSFDSLTDRELAILKLISYGHSRKEIADQLFLSTHTIDDYMKRLLKKFSARNSADLIRICFLEGVLVIEKDSIQEE